MFTGADPLVCMYTYIQVLIHYPRQVYVYIYTYVYIHIYTYTYMHIHMYTYVHIHIYTYIHICIYTGADPLPARKDGRHGRPSLLYLQKGIVLWVCVCVCVYYWVMDIYI